MQKIGPMLANALLQIGDGAGQLGSLILQRRDNMRLSHITILLITQGYVRLPAASEKLVWVAAAT